MGKVSTRNFWQQVIEALQLLFAPIIGSLALETASHLIKRMVKKPSEESHGGMRPPAKSQRSELPWKWILWPLSGHQMTSAQIDILTATSREALSQNHPDKLPLISRSTETVREYLFLAACKFRHNLLHNSR